MPNARLLQQQNGIPPSNCVRQAAGSKSRHHCVQGSKVVVGLEFQLNQRLHKSCFFAARIISRQYQGVFRSSASLSLVRTHPAISDDSVLTSVHQADGVSGGRFSNTEYSEVTSQARTQVLKTMILSPSSHNYKAQASSASRLTNSRSPACR